MPELILSSCIVEKKEIKGKGEIIYIIGRDATKCKHVVEIYNFKPFFYVDGQRNVPNDDRIAKTDSGFKSYKEIDVKKIETVNSYDVGTRTHRGIKHYFVHADRYECDVPFPTRFKLTKKIKCGVKIRW